MEESKATIEVSEDLARAYRKASPEQRVQAERAMAVALLSRAELADEFDRITQRASEYASEQGLTPDVLTDLLKENGK